MRPNFYAHIHPPTIPEKQARFSFTLGLGGMSVFLVLILTITGMLETFYYIPTPDDAAHSVQALSYLVPFGWLVRNIHFWSAQFLVMTAAFHLARVVFTAAYAAQRRFNYLLGVILFLLIILLDFSGYVLRWDQGIQWALVAGTNLIKSIPGIGEKLYGIVVGGMSPGAATLIRFYSWHIYGLMLSCFVLIAWHIFRVRRDGGIAAPPPDLRVEGRRISRQDLVRKEVVAMLICTAVLVLISILIPAPIAPAITKIQVGSNEATAPWFFLWVQQLLKWGNPFLFGVLIPVILLAVIAMIPYLFPQPSPSDFGRWFPSSNRPAQIALAVIAAAVLILTLSGMGLPS